MTDLNSVVTQQEFGALVGVSQQAVAELQARGVLAKEMTGIQALHAYCSHLRETAAGRLASGDLDLAAERAALAKAQRERIELQNAVTRREQAPVALIEEVLAKVGSKVGGILDAVVPRLRRRNRSLTAEDLQFLEAEISRARRMAAGIRLATLDDDAETTAALDVA